MSILNNQPDNINFLSPFGFSFTLKRSPTVNFFCTDISIPSVSFGDVSIPTPFKNYPIPGNKLQYGDLKLTFKVDENLVNYLEIYNWLHKIAKPESFEQYASLSQVPGSGEGAVSDATLTILNSAMGPNAEVQFQDLFPVSLGEIAFTTTDTDVNYITVTADFKFSLMKVVKL